MQDRLASIGQLVSGVAHELNNPLTSVVGFSDLLLKQKLPDGVHQDLQIVNSEANRAALIVRNLLTFARQKPQEKQQVNVTSTIRTVLQLRAHEQFLNNIVTQTNFLPDLPAVNANESQLLQVFVNLVANAEDAIKEVHQTGNITITTKLRGNYIQVTFRDDGTGISQENMKRIFSPFFTTKRVGKGTGLGLSISQGIISEHNGRIWVESEPGGGATFFVELPAFNTSNASATG